jgi:hypothetical protein
LTQRQLHLHFENLLFSKLLDGHGKKRRNRGSGCSRESPSFEVDPSFACASVTSKNNEKIGWRGFIDRVLCFGIRAAMVVKQGLKIRLERR